MYIVSKPRPKKNKVFINVLEYDPGVGTVEFVERDNTQKRVDELIEEFKAQGSEVYFHGFPFHYSIYVVGLKEGVRGERKMISQNDEARTPTPIGYLYVGLTGLPVEKRIEHHVSGHKSCNLVKRYFTGTVVETRTNLLYREAVALERSIAEDYRTRGYWVYQN